MRWTTASGGAMGSIAIWLGTVPTFIAVGLVLVAGYLWFLGLSEREAPAGRS